MFIYNKNIKVKLSHYTLFTLVNYCMCNVSNRMFKKYVHITHLNSNSEVSLFESAVSTTSEVFAIFLSRTQTKLRGNILLKQTTTTFSGTLLSNSLCITTRKVPTRSNTVCRVSQWQVAVVPTRTPGVCRLRAYK